MRGPKYVPEEFFDIDHYIKRVLELKKAAGKEHKSIFDVLLVRLNEAKKKCVPLLDIAEGLNDAVGPCRKGEPEAFHIYRRLADAIRGRRELK